MTQSSQSTQETPVSNMSGQRKAERSAASVPANEGIKFESSVLIHRPAREIYDYWRDFTHAPLFMSDIKKVEITGKNTSRWTATGPYDIEVEWDAQLINDKPGEMLSWRTVGETHVPNAGTVRFEPVTDDTQGEAGESQDATRVRLVAEFQPPGGPLAVITAAFFFQDPQRVLSQDLRRLKEILEGHVSVDEAPTSPTA
jgi:uncharacterized membrane protein